MRESIKGNKEELAMQTTTNQYQTKPEWMKPETRSESLFFFTTWQVQPWERKKGGGGCGCLEEDKLEKSLDKIKNPPSSKRPPRPTTEHNHARANKNPASPPSEPARSGASFAPSFYRVELLPCVLFWGFSFGGYLA